jgi:hypothetical protein
VFRRNFTLPTLDGSLPICNNKGPISHFSEECLAYDSTSGLVLPFQTVGLRAAHASVDAGHFLQPSLRSWIALAAESLSRFLPTRTAEDLVDLLLQVRGRDG